MPITEDGETFHYVGTKEALRLLRSAPARVEFFMYVDISAHTENGDFLRENHAAYPRPIVELRSYLQLTRKQALDLAARVLKSEHEEKGARIQIMVRNDYSHIRYWIG